MRTGGAGSMQAPPVRGYMITSAQLAAACQLCRVAATTVRLWSHTPCCAQAPPTPEVDPANAEFVLFVRSTKVSECGARTSHCNAPLRCSTSCEPAATRPRLFHDPSWHLQLPQWCPLSVVKGGQAANLLIRSMDSPWGLKMFGNTLVRNIATVVYQASPSV